MSEVESKKALKEYEKDPNDVKSLMKWLTEKPHLPKITEFQAVAFLNSTYYDLDAAKITIETYFALRTRHCDMFAPILDEGTIRNTLAFMYISVFDSPDGHAIFFCKLLDPDVSLYNHSNFLKLLDMSLMSYLYTFGPARGLIFIFDMDGCTLSHLFKMNIRMSQVYMNYLQNGLPMRLTKIHFLNTSSVTKALMNLTKPFLKKETAESLEFHCGDNRTIFEYFPEEFLDEHFTGEKAKTIDELTENLMENLEMLRHLQRQRIDETKKTQTVKNCFFTFR